MPPINASAAFAAGKTASVTIGSTTYRFEDWSSPMEGDIIDTSNFVDSSSAAGGKRTNIGGLAGCNFTLKGKHDIGGMPFTLLSTYTCILVYGAFSFTVTGRLKSISPSVNIAQAGMIDFNFVSTGDFTASVA